MTCPRLALLLLSVLLALPSCRKSGGRTVVPVTLQVLGSTPAAQQEGVDPEGTIRVTFDQALAESLSLVETIRLLDDENHARPIVVSIDATRTIVTVEPETVLPPGSDCTLELDADLASASGHRLGRTERIVFRTDLAPFRASLAPFGQVVSLAPEATLSAVFTRPVDPATVRTSNFVLFDEGVEVAGNLEVESEGRVVRFEPSSPLRPFRFHRLVVLGGEDGVRDSAGRFLANDLESLFLTTSEADEVAPSFTLSLQGIEHEDERPLAVLGFGFRINVELDDDGTGVDLASLRITADVPAGDLPAGTDLADRLVIDDGGSAHLRFAADRPFEPGALRLTVEGRDLAGNVGAPAWIDLEVVPGLDALRPFRRTQYVKLNFDSDRDGAGWTGDGRADLDQDLLRYGLNAEGDPLGSNALVRQALLGAVFERAHLLFGRSPQGSPRVGGTDIVFTIDGVPGEPVTELCIGGFDPSQPGRDVGDDSTHVIGRAFFDARNHNNAEFNCFASLGLGVFPGELFLSQLEFWKQVQPSFSTTFGDTYQAISPHFGGTPLGADSRDALILDPDFDYLSASPLERKRFDQYTLARDRLASAIATLIAHELGHSLGLTMPGELPSGLHGTSGFHNDQARFIDVMSSALSFEVLISEGTRFRPVNHAYLGEGLILR